MDLGCIDMGCVEKDNNSPKESASKPGKNNKAKDAVRSSLNALNKLTSQITKPPHRKTSSPLNWFPRKKVEPYLKRKIKMLQEGDGMHSTLDETLGDSNPHYSKVLREKIAIREAAEKAMEARKAAMVEASWCRILQAARIESKEAEAQLSKAELSASEAFEAAREAGVIMNDIPDGPQSHFKIETSSGKEEMFTHTVSATFETAFEVDKQVARAVKAAFIKLANCPSINKDEFKELLRKISENPDTDKNRIDESDITSECGTDVESELCNNEFNGSKLKKHEKGQEIDNFSMSNIVDMMLGRIRCLKEHELASLATIVATSGLNAVLAETGNSKRSSLSSAVENNDLKVSKRMSRGGVELLPSLDKFLVKRLTRLENEVLEAKNARNNDEGKRFSADNTSSTEGSKIPDLGSVLVKHSSKLEKEVEEARMNNKSPSGTDSNKFQRATTRIIRAKQTVDEVSSLDKFLVKRLSRLEREVDEAKNGKKPFSSKGGKENLDLNKIENKNTTSSTISHKDNDAISNYESLDKVLVKHVSRLEKAKMDFHGDEQMRVRPKRKDACREMESGEGSLDQVLVKHKSRLEREQQQMAANFERQDDENSTTRPSVSRRQAREKELQAAWGGLSLGNSMRPHVSRLQRDKAEWLKAEEDERKREVEGEV